VDWRKEERKRKVIDRSMAKAETEGSQRKASLIFRFSDGLFFFQRNKIDPHLVRQSLTTLALPLPTDGISHFLRGSFFTYIILSNTIDIFLDLYLYKRMCYKYYKKENNC